MNQIGIPESERQELLAYLTRTYRYENGGIVNRRTGRRRQGSRTKRGYLAFSFSFKGGVYCSQFQRIVWVLCCNKLPTQIIDHINGDKLDNRIENLREITPSENNLNTMLRWQPNKDTGVASVDCHGTSFRVRIRSAHHFFSNPYEAFYWAIACGKRYRNSEIEKMRE